MCHPTELRAISVGEAAAIQEFPGDWVFLGSTSEKFKQIGNAVPTRLGKVAGKAIKELIARIEAGEAPPPYLRSGEVFHLRPHVRTRSFWKNGQVFAGDVSYYDDEEDKAEELNSNQLSIPFTETCAV